MIVDASMAMAWCFEDERSDETDAVLASVVASGGVVPPLWSAEVANVLVVAERRGRISPADVAQFVDLLERLPLSVWEPDGSMSEVIACARQYDLSAYDATYLVAAMREGLPLATLDASLRRGASGAGVSVLPGHDLT